MSAVRWQRRDRRLVAATARGSVEIPFKDRDDLGKRRHPYVIVVRSPGGLHVDRTEGFHSLRETKELAEEFIAAGLA